MTIYDHMSEALNKAYRQGHNDGIKDSSTEEITELEYIIEQFDHEHPDAEKPNQINISKD